MDNGWQCRTGKALRMSTQLVLVLQSISAEFQTFVTELKTHVHGPGVREAEEALWEGGTMAGLAAASCQ